MPSTSVSSVSLARTSFALFAMSLVVFVLAGALSSRPLAGVLLGAVAVEMIAQRFGAGWEAGPNARQDALRSALVGGLATITVLVGGLLTGQARFVFWGVDLVGLFTGLLAVLALAFRDEIWLRWAPWRLLAPFAPGWLRVATPVALGGVASLGDRAFHPAAVALAVASGALSLAWVRRTEGLVASVAVAASVRLLSNPTVLGLECRWKGGSLTPLEAASGPGAWGLAVALALAAWLVWRRGPAQPSMSNPNIPSPPAQKSKSNTPISTI